MAVFVQQVGTNLPASQISFIRGLFTFCLLTPACYKKVGALARLKESKAIWFRSIAGAVAVLCYFYNTTHGSAAEAKALANINPFYVAILSWYFFGERLSRKEALGLGILLYGAGLLAWRMSSLGQNSQWLIGNFGALFTSVAYLSLKKASAKHPATLIVYCFGFCIMLISAFGPGDWIIPQSHDIIWLSLIGITGLMGQLFLTHSHIHLKNTVASSLTLLTSIILIAYDGIITLRLNNTSLIGNSLILLGMAVLIVNRSRAKTTSGPILMSPQQKESP